MEAPEVRYAKSGRVNIAYGVVGDGPFDLVFIVGSVFTTLENAWDGLPRDFFSRLAAFSRLIIFDKRGTGLSDRVTGVPDLETRMDDVRAVMDAASSRRAAIMGVSEGGGAPRSDISRVLCRKFNKTVSLHKPEGDPEFSSRFQELEEGILDATRPAEPRRKH